MIYWTQPKQTLRNFPLFTRGWVYQERLLCPRLVQFSNREVRWECNQFSVCQCTPQPRYPPDFNLWHAAAIALHPNSVPNSENIGRRWRQIVSEYTALDLTIPGDRLPAIRGCAVQ